MKCVFKYVENQPGIVACAKCGQTMLRADHPLDRYHGRPCDSADGPNIARRIKNFAKAKAKDVKARMPRRSEEEALTIVAICETNECGLYDAKRERCLHRDCGCGVKKKAAYYLERCPVGLW